MSFQIQKKYPLNYTQTIDIQKDKNFELGITLDKRVAAFVGGLKLLNDAATFATTKGSRAICVATTLGVAINNLIEGNVFSGGIQAVSGLKEGYDLFMKNGSFAEIQNLIKENQAGLELTNEILNFNQVILNHVTEGTHSVERNLSLIGKDIERIQNFSDQGRGEIQEEKEVVKEHYYEADQIYQKAKENFKKSQEYIDRANAYFNETQNGFNEIYELAKKEDAKISDAVVVAERMQGNCRSAQENLKKGIYFQKTAMEQLDRANEMYRKASEGYGKIVGKAETLLTQIHETGTKAKNKVETAQQQTAQVSQALVLAQNNHTVLGQINKKLLETNTQLLEEVIRAESYGKTSILLGAIPGALLGNAVAGTPGALVVGTGGLELMHNRYILMGKVADWMFGIKKESKVIFSEGQKVAGKFDDYSSGYWGRYFGKRASQTVGMIAIKFNEDEIFEMRFNLKNKNPVKDADLRKLQEILKSKLDSKEISSEQCLSYIQDLENTKIDSKPVIAQDNPFFYLLKNQCIEASKI